VFNQNFFSIDDINKKELISEDSTVVFVSDLFSEDYVGGAELTTESLINFSGLKIDKVRSRDITREVLSKGIDKYWIFANFSQISQELIPAIIANMKYSIIEYDFKYCKFRSPEKHTALEESACDCHTSMYGKLISAFFFGSDNIFWMSENQKNRYYKVFPFLEEKNNVTVSSIFSPDFFKTISSLNGLPKSEKYLIINSDSWIKGTEDAVEHCEKNNLEYEKVSGLAPDKLLRKLAESKGLVFLPRGGDTCPRLVIEAKLLGAELIINENVLHKDEEWFNTHELKNTINWLMSGPERFWSTIAETMAYRPTISGYTTAYNCISQKYPFAASIGSMLEFCDQVVVVDGGSEDGTYEKLIDMAKSDSRLLIHQQKRDWSDKRFAVFDGLQKALARALCTGEFCWQQDSDEVVHESDYEKIHDLIKNLPKAMDLIALPVIEFWGKSNKIRIDVNPWKWRLSRNKPHITHGIPGKLRQFDSSGRLFAKPGTDGCDYIRSDNFEPVPFTNFYGEPHHKMRMAAMTGKEPDIIQYGEWLHLACSKLPVVMHYSWFDIERKIKTYKNYWQNHWESLYDIKQEDISDNNMFFNKSWADVTDKEIKEMSEKLEAEMGGWIFHSKVDFDKPTPFLMVNEDVHSAKIKEWIK